MFEPVARGARQSTALPGENGWQGAPEPASMGTGTGTGTGNGNGQWKRALTVAGQTVLNAGRRSVREAAYADRLADLDAHQVFTDQQASGVVRPGPLNQFLERHLR